MDPMEKSSLKRRGMLSSGVKAADLGFEGKDLASSAFNLGFRAWGL